MKSQFQAMFTDFDEGESHFSQADPGTRNLRMQAVLLSMTDQDLAGKNQPMMSHTAAVKYRNHETSDDVLNALQYASPLALLRIPFCTK